VSHVLDALSVTWSPAVTAALVIGIIVAINKRYS